MVLAQDAPTTEVDELLADGWRRYSEELDFEGAVTAYQTVVDHPESSNDQKLEAYEYLAACRFALGDTEGARQALTELLGINPDQQLNDPSHSPDLLQLLEDIRTDMPEDSVEDLYPENLDDLEQPPGLVTETGEGDGREEPGEVEEPIGGTTSRPWYRTWWFWTITGVVVVGAITAGAVAGTRDQTPEVPQGSLDPGVVQLPCLSGFR